MSKEQIQQAVNWGYKGIVTVLLIVIGTILHDTWTTFGQTRDSIIRLEVQFNDFKTDTDRRLEHMEGKINKMK